MTLALVTATEKEMRAALGFLASPPEVRRDAPAPVTLGDRQVLACVSGVGVLNAALFLGGLLAGRGLEQYGPLEGVLNVGLAGSFDLRRLGLGVPLVVRREVWPEYGLHRDCGADAKGLGFALGQVAGEPVWDRLDLDVEAMAQSMHMSLPKLLFKAVSLTVSSVTATADRAGKLAAAFDADVENMEGFSLAYGCAVAGVPFLEARTVSNLVGSRAREDWDLDGALAALGPLCAGLLTI